MAVAASTPLQFLLNGEPVAVAGVSPQTTLLEYLREHRRLTGTKEGCAEGDCGACTVVLAERDPASGMLAWQPINACIRLLPSVDGKAVYTVESLQAPDGTPHPVQRALVDCHGSQCGFCTPGFAMSLFGLYKNSARPSRQAIDDALSGNLCRCTGYRPIVAAAQAMYDASSGCATGDWRAPGFNADGSRRTENAQLATTIAVAARTDTLDYEAAGARWIAPRTIDALADVLRDHPYARIVAGTTDVGLWITKQQRDLPVMVAVGEVTELRAIRGTPTHVETGAAASLTAAFAAFDAHWPELHEAWIRFASVPIRNSATLGGNIANGSPIGDSMPILLALDATVVLRRGTITRQMPLDEFYLGYQKTALAPGEFVAAVRIPRRPANMLLRAYKISKRFDQDISAVFACFAFTMNGDCVTSARIGCGGIAATPTRARKTEALVAGRQWDEAAAEAAAAVLYSEFTPLDDMRASAAYRRTVLANLLRRFHLETAGACALTRVDDTVGAIAS
jgi:xanthine dehydrogenase small subunit